MFFDKTVTIKQVFEFEEQRLSEFLNSSLFTKLNKEARQNGFKCDVFIYRENQCLSDYHSYINIDILDMNGRIVAEYDEPNCCLSIGEPLCFMRRHRIYGIDICADQEFASAVIQLVDGIKMLKIVD